MTRLLTSPTSPLATSLLVVLALATPADARPSEPIVVATTDPAFRAALGEALAPAGMTVRPVTDPPPFAIVDMTTSSRELADRELASATVWLLSAAGGTTLVTYDRGVDRVLVRSLPYVSPLSAAQAAEIARMTRTMLRALRVTPDTDQLPPRAGEAPAVRASAATRELPASTLAIELGAGVRMRGPGATAAATGALAITWRPDQLGVTLAGQLSPAADVRGAGFTGQIADRSIAVLARLPLRATPRIGVAGVFGPTLHVITLEGELPERAIDERRLDPAIRVGLTASYALRPTIAIGLGVWADWLLRRQVYEAGPDEVLRIPLVQVSTGLVVTARIL